MATDIINTFWSLVNRHRVEIPIIQRDFAQGRKEDRVKQIRKSFVASLVNALETETPMGLDFIYGKIRGGKNQVLIERNKQSITSLLKSVRSYAKNLSVDFKFDINGEALGDASQPDTWFVPLDGQQRLTTLFLLHWYISRRQGVFQPSLANFTYKTRKSSRDFCHSIVQHTLEIEFNEETISDSIVDENWFFDRWKDDPTVSGMLTMLDEIHLQLGSKSDNEFNHYWSSLTERKLIYFDFLNLDSYDLEDELYIKMNARGKPLTDFENFKAWLQKYVQKKKINVPENAFKNMDGNWSDLFWEIQSGLKDIGPPFLELFKTFGLYGHLRRTKLEGEQFNDQDQKIYYTLSGNNFISNAFFEEHKIYDNSVLGELFGFLQLIDVKGYTKLQGLLEEMHGAPFAPEDDSFQAFLLGFSSLNLSHKTFYYAVVVFLRKQGLHLNDYHETDWDSLRDWLRVCRNLIYNSTIDNLISFHRAILAIETLSPHYNSILTFLANPSSQKNVPFFPKRQREEEALKASFRTQHNWLAWKSLMLTYENQQYFYGQIGFLFELAKEPDGNYNLVKFQKYGDRSSEIFVLSELNGNQHLIERALLTKSDGDYMIPKSSNWSFCRPSSGSARDRNENWRNVFNDSEKRSILQELLDDPRSLSEIIEDERSQISDWRKPFLDHPECINYCRQRLIRWEDNGEYIRLLGASRLSHYHSELRSYALFLSWEKASDPSSLLANNPFKKFKYTPVRKSSEYPRIHFYKLKKGGATQILISYRHGEKTFVISMHNKKKGNIDSHILSNIPQHKITTRDDGKGVLINAQNEKEVERLMASIFERLNEQ